MTETGNGYVILDLETRGDRRLLETYCENLKAPGNIKDLSKIEANLLGQREAASKAMAVDQDFSEIICIGVKIEGEKAQLMNLKEFTEWIIGFETDETGRKKYNMYKKLITFNGKEFDLPILIKSAIKADIKNFPFAHFKMLMDKYKAKNGHCDMMQDLAMKWGANKSLDKYLQIYLGFKKTPIDFETASEKEIKLHCLEDLENTEKLYLKFKPYFEA